MRISDWSSDVCSSDLIVKVGAAGLETRTFASEVQFVDGVGRVVIGVGDAALDGIDAEEPTQRWDILPRPHLDGQDAALMLGQLQIGIASCRERVCQYV